MEASNRTATSDLIDDLLKNSKRYSFFQAVKLLETAYSQNVPTGRQGPLNQETIRFLANPSLSFPSSDIEAISENKEFPDVFPPFQMTVNFLGLYGPSSPLPTFYTEEIIRIDQDESHVSHFLDIFNHRFTSFFYRCWEKYRYYILYRPGGTDEFSAWMFSLIGLGNPIFRKDTSIKWAKLLPYLGLLGMNVRSASVLSKIISHYFGFPSVSIQEYILQKVVIDEDQKNKLGKINCSLGMDCSLGSTVHDFNNKYKIKIGPLNFKAFQEFLPGGSDYRALRELAMFVSTDKLDFDVELLLDSKNVPQTALVDNSPCQLGFSTWLGGNRAGLASVVQSGALSL